MKHASLLIALCVLFGVSSYAQTTTTVEKNATRITITTKKVDENGKTITETYIAEGDEPGEILKGMAVNPEIIQRVDVTNPETMQGERLFLIRQAGDKMKIEGLLDENAQIEVKELENAENIEKVIIINKDGGVKGRECVRMQAYGNGEHARAWSMGHNGKSNCAALGVYVNSTQTGGSRISSLIEKGGALEAGLKEGDVITRIDEFDVTDFGGLHLALSHFQPGDVVTVRFDREGKSQRTRVELKNWKDLPGHEWRSRTDCGQPTVVEETKTEESILRDNQPSGLQTLEVEDATIYPNPTEGLFAVSFTTTPGPITVAVTDVNGKVVYQDNSENKDGLYKKEIDLKGLPQGNYILSVTQNDKVFTEQISKQ